MGNEMKLDSEKLSKAIEGLIDELYSEEDVIKKAKAPKSDKEKEKEDNKASEKEAEASEGEEEEEEEEEKEEKSKGKKSMCKGEEEDESEQKSISANEEVDESKLYKSGYMHGVEFAHGSKEGLTESLNKSEHYKKGFKAGHESAKVHLEKENMQKSILSDEVSESLIKAMNTLTETVTSLKAQNESLSKSVEQLSKAPAGRKSVQAVDFIQKGNVEGKEEGAEEAAPSRNLSKSFERASGLLYEEGIKKGLLQPRDVAEFEFSKSHSNPETFRIIKGIVNKHINEGSF